MSQPVKSISSGGCAAAGIVVATLFLAGCGGPEGAGTVHMAAVKAAADRRGLSDAKRPLPAGNDAARASRGNASKPRGEPQRQGHR